MTGSEADSERDLEGDGSGKADSMKLAKFLTPVVPKPKSSAPPPAPDIAPSPPAAPPPERTGLFSDLPVPRRNSSMLPPPGDVQASEPPRPAATTTTSEQTFEDAPDSEREFDDAAPSSDLSFEDEPPSSGSAFEERESPTSNLTLEKNLRSELRDSEPHLDFEPPARGRFGRANLRTNIQRAAMVLGVLIGTAWLAMAV